VGDGQCATVNSPTGGSLSALRGRQDVAGRRGEKRGTKYMKGKRRGRTPPPPGETWRYGGGGGVSCNLSSDSRVRSKQGPWKRQT